MADQAHDGCSRSRTVSILLCNYNDSQFLADSLGGICGQTRPADEIVIVDDGSTDDSLRIIASFAERYPAIRVLRNDQNRGLMYSIHRALEEARMEFVVWASADDVLLPIFLERNFALLEQFPEAVMSCSRLATFIDGTDEVVHYTPELFRDAFDLGPEPTFLTPAAFEKRLGLSHLWISGNTVVVRREKLIAFGGFDPKLRWHADWFTFYALALRHGICLIPETLAMMRVRPGTFSSTGMHNKEEQRKTLQILIDTIRAPRNRDIRGIVYRRPAVLSPFGKNLLFAAMRRPRSWVLAGFFGRWLVKHWLKSHGLGWRNVPRHLLRKYLGKPLLPSAQEVTANPPVGGLRAVLPLSVKVFLKKAFRL